MKVGEDTTVEVGWIVDGFLMTGGGVSVHCGGRGMTAEVGVTDFLIGLHPNKANMRTNSEKIRNTSFVIP